MAVWIGTGWPSHGVGLRNASGAPVRIVTAEGERPVGDVDRARAPEQVHRGASYLHQGQHWRVVDLDLDTGVARVEPDDGATYTVPRRDTRIRLLGADAARDVGRARLHLGGAEVHTTVVGFQRKDALTGGVVERQALDLPTSVLVTRAVWYVIDPELVVAAGLEAAQVGPALHALEHAAIGMLPLFAICDRWDVGGVSTARQPDTGRPTVVIYDALPGGAGVAELGFEAADRHLHATLESVAACPCREGCPSCVQSPKCGNANEHLDKAGALALLRAVLGQPRPVTAAPQPASSRALG
jgi:DEAD/DEAH box helicase domain-containing protein